MKRIYLPLVFSLLAISGCSDKNNAEVTPSSVSEKKAADTAEVENDKKEVQALQNQINITDKEIDQMVYKLYDLTEEEIKIVEGL